MILASELQGSICLSSAIIRSTHNYTLLFYSEILRANRWLWLEGKWFPNYVISPAKINPCNYYLFTFIFFYIYLHFQFLLLLSLVYLSQSPDISFQWHCYKIHSVHWLFFLIHGKIPILTLYLSYGLISSLLSFIICLSDLHSFLLLYILCFYWLFLNSSALKNVVFFLDHFDSGFTLWVCSGYSWRLQELSLNPELS